MPDSKYLCDKCQTLFELSVEDNPVEGKAAKCTDCGSTDVQKLNVCSLNMHIDTSGPPPWEYICHQCNVFFEVPVPHGPDEAKQIKCPECGSQDIERVNVVTLELLEHPCG